MSVGVVVPSKTHSVDGFENKVHKAWKSALGNFNADTEDPMSHPDEESSVECGHMYNRVYPEITLRNSCGWGQLRYSREAPTTELAMPRVRDRILEDRRRKKTLSPLKSCSEPPRNSDRWEDGIARASHMAVPCITSGRVNLKGTSGFFVRGDDSESSLAEENKASSHLNIRTSQRGGGENKTRTVNSLSPCAKHSVTKIPRFSNLQPSVGLRLQARTGDAQSRLTETNEEQYMGASKSEGHLSTTCKASRLLPKMNRPSSGLGVSRGHQRKRRHQLVLPPGCQKAVSRSSTARHMEANIDKLHASTLERQALHERVLGYLSDGSRLHAERCRKLRGDQDDISLVSSKSSSSLAWIGENGPCDAVWKGRTDIKEDWSKFRTTINSKERRMAQKLRAEEVLRRKRDQEEEHRRYIIDHQRVAAPKPAERTAERQRAEALLVVVTCALARKCRQLRAKRTWMAVRSAGPAVLKLMYRMRLRGESAKEVVADRRKREAADLIVAMLKAGTRSLFRTKIARFCEKIKSCQRYMTSFIAISLARKKALALKWTRQVGKLDEKRFHMYLAHLRDMYSFDPKAVDTILKDMRILAENVEQNERRIKKRSLPKPITHACRTKNHQAVAVKSGEGNDQSSKSSPAEDGAIKLGESNIKTSIRSTAAVEQVTKPPRVKLASGWQNRVEQMKGDMILQASLMSKRGVKHKEISRTLRSMLINDILSQARRVHKDWFWYNVREVRLRKKYPARVNIADVKRALGVLDPHFLPEEGVLESKIESATSAEEDTFPLREHPGMQLMNMVTDDLLTRYIIFAERIEGCVSVDGSGTGMLSPFELQEVFVINRHPSQNDTSAVKEVKGELHAWATTRGFSPAAVSNKRISGTKKVSYGRQQKTIKQRRASTVEEVPYYDFMNFVKRKIMLDICMPGDQRVSVEAPHQFLEMPILKASC